MPNKPTFEDEGWAEHLLDRRVSLEMPKLEPVRAGSLWTSKATGRRGMIRWTSAERCCLAFSEFRSHELSTDDLRRLYTPV